MKNVLISGGSGLIGMRLSEMLLKKGYQVRHLSRTVSGKEKYPTFKWDVKQSYIDPEGLAGINHVIHLAGANVSDGRWTDEKKKIILDSRVETAKCLIDHVRKHSLITFITASGISYYGTLTSEQIFKEDDLPGSDFIAQVSVEWEKAAAKSQEIANKFVALRTGIVLSKKGGALEKLVKPVKYGVGSPLGSGNQYMPWIHLDDLCEMYIAAIENPKIKGIYNAVSSEHITNKEFTEAIAKVLGKSLWAPAVPAIALKALFGEMSGIILKGSRIDNQKIKEAGFEFKYEKVVPALTDLLKN
jgi:uncharacterized protein (TIGR01777 family)